MAQTVLKIYLIRTLAIDYTVLLTYDNLEVERKTI
jgi:hypothetical protein